ncbi:MAG: thiol:disulfide interchange protein, partial [Porphyromonadaceae bacterium]|nr:thiol:disulfide interchange protein [Porphyromonadaceae bacterium]
MKIPSSRHLARRLGVLLLPLALLLTSLGAKAQIIRDAVSWSHSVEDKSPTEKVIVFSATIKGDWHLYGTDLPSGGPTPTSLIVDKIAGAQLVGKLTASKKPIEKHDPNFDMMLRFYSGQVSFRQTLRITDPKAFAFSGAIRYMVCNDEQCLPPTNWDFTIALKELGKVAAAPAAEQTEAKAEAAPTAELAQPLTADSTQQAADSAAVAPAEPSDA